MKTLDAATIETMLAAQGIELAAGRAERLAPGVNALNVDDPVGAALPFEADPTTYVVVRERLK